ncbi:XF1762 family protein, partial [Pseudomonas aeruginosa]|uniref:XF1762 family protein n=1 Tax=Pseudomonas aeruginosa TaxID=287 RepID=UPI0035B67B78
MPSEHHRHHRSVQGAKFAIAVALPGSDGICGVAIVGRPVARHLDDGWTLEVTRLCTNGAPNACSKLYGAAWKAAKALGYTRLITYSCPRKAVPALSLIHISEPTRHL